MIRERIEQELKENKQLRAYVRKLADCTGRRYPIVMVDGDLAPKRFGRRGVRVKKRKWDGSPYETWRGTVAGYYAYSSQRIEVGSDWLLEELLSRNYMKVKYGKEKEK